MREGDYVYLLAPPERAQALDRFFVDMPPPAAPDPRLLERFLRLGRRPRSARLAEIYGLQVAADDVDVTLADYLRRAFIERPPRPAMSSSSVRSRWWRIR